MSSMCNISNDICFRHLLTIELATVDIGDGGIQVDTLQIMCKDYEEPLDNMLNIYGCSNLIRTIIHMFMSYSISLMHSGFRINGICPKNFLISFSVAGRTVSLSLRLSDTIAGNTLLSTLENN